MRLREGAGGGSRVSAATVEGPWRPDDIVAAEATMRAQGHAPLFMLRAGDEGLDVHLAARGYACRDSTLILAAPLARLDAAPADTLWPPAPVQTALWATGGIGPARIAVMQRAAPPRAVLRHADGCAFIARHEGIAMLHALEVAARARRRGAGSALMAMAAGWARQAGAGHLALAVTRANGPARALYDRLGYEEITQYHYRRRAP